MKFTNGFTRLRERFLRQLNRGATTKHNILQCFTLQVLHDHNKFVFQLIDSIYPRQMGKIRTLLLSLVNGSIGQTNPWTKLKIFSYERAALNTIIGNESHFFRYLECRLLHNLINAIMAIGFNKQQKS